MCPEKAPITIDGGGEERGREGGGKREQQPQQQPRTLGGTSSSLCTRLYTRHCAGYQRQMWMNPSPSPQRAQSYYYNLKSVPAHLYYQRPAKSPAFCSCLDTMDWPQSVGAANIPTQDQYVLDLRNNRGYGIIPALRRVQASQGDKRTQTHLKVRQLGTAKPSAKCGKALWSLRQPEMALEEEEEHQLPPAHRTDFEWDVGLWRQENWKTDIGTSSVHERALQSPAGWRKTLPSSFSKQKSS